MKIVKISAIILLITILGVNALVVFDKQCQNDGSLKLVVKADSKAKVYTDDILVKAGQMPMPGTWDTLFLTRSTSASREYSTFQSEENILTAERPYPITLTYVETNDDGSKTPRTISFEVECPGFVFSCKNLNMTIESCETQNQGVFRAVLTVGGLEQSEAAKMDIMKVVDFILDAENKYVDMTGKETSRGTLPLKSQVLRLEKDRYVIRYEFSSKHNNTINTFWAGYNKNLRYPCEEDKYPEVSFYDNAECKKQEQPEEEVKEETPIETEPAQEQKTTEKKKTAEDLLKEQPKNYKPLAIVSIILIAVLSVGGIVLSYLYKRGYL